MKNIGTFVVIGIVLIFVFLGCNGYNKVVKEDVKVNTAWNNVNTEYQRRADLVDNLVNTVKGAANFEQETLTKVIEARAKATSINVNAENLTPEKMQQFQAAQGEMTSALSRLMVVIEKYPDLKANQNFLQLQGQLEGIENDIRNVRKTYNEAVRDYNLRVRSFPMNLLASMFGFKAKAGFEADAGAEKAPKVQF